MAAMLNARILFRSTLAVMALNLPLATAAPTPSDTTPSETTAAEPELFNRLDADRDGRLTATEIPAEQKRLFARLVRTADTDGNQALSRDEFTAGLRPSRAEKPLVEKRTEAFFGADALRYLLLRMDTNGNSQLEPDEIPADLREPFDRMLQMRDQDKSGILEWDELVRGGLHLAPYARRRTDQQGIDVAVETARLRKSLGSQADRFDWEPLPGNLFGNQREVRRLFGALDRNGNQQLEEAEIPLPFRDRFEQLVRLADADGDEHLTRPEFRTGAQRLAELVDPAERSAGVVNQMTEESANNSMEMPADRP